MRWWPFGRSAPIASQVTVLILIGVLVAQLASAAIVLVLPRPLRADHQPALVAQLLTGQATDGRFAVSTRPEPPQDDYEDQDERAFRDALAAALAAPPEQVRVIIMAGPPRPGRSDGPGAGPKMGPPDGPQRFVAARQRPDGQWQVAEESNGGLLDPWQRRALVWLLVAVLVVAPVAWFFARRFSQPIRRFAEAAERVGRNPQADPIQVSGPAEVEEAAAAFRLMQERLKRYVEDRTGMVAGIAHDLRTPLTRLAFRLEALPDADREAALGDIEEMQAMISSTLDYVRDMGGTAQRVPTDMAALIAALPGDLPRLRDRIAVTPSEPLLAEVDPTAIRRLLANLAGNAVVHGGSARVTMRRDADMVVVDVDDDGPGLPEAEMERVFEPFHRGDPSRSKATGGHGLGLAIARSIAAAHGGTVRLENRAEGGLRATVTLPV